MTRILDTPVAAPLLQDTVKAGDSVTIAVPDKTRLCRTRDYLPHLLARLEDAGVQRSAITLLFATGTHPPQTNEERRAILGDEILSTYRVEEHDSRDEASMVLAGTTAYGTELRLNRLLLEADVVIATGAIVHHYFAGFGGGPKLFVPGCASYEAAVQNHRRSLTDDGHFHPACADGSIEENPVMLDIRDALRFLPPQYYLGVVLDAQGELYDGVCGDVVEAHRRGSHIVDSLYRVQAPYLADFCIASAGGCPKDINFIQAHKSIHHAAYVLRDGGCVIVLASCPEGIGNSSFLQWFAGENDQAFRARVMREYSMNAHTAVALREKTSRLKVILVSGLEEHTVRKLGMTPARNLQEAVGIAAEYLPTAPRGLLLGNASLIVPYL